MKGLRCGARSSSSPQYEMTSSFRAPPTAALPTRRLISRIRATQGSSSNSESISSDESVSSSSSNAHPSSPWGPGASGPASIWTPGMKGPASTWQPPQTVDAHFLQLAASAPALLKDDDEPCVTEPPNIWIKVIPLGAIFFLASFNLTILQNLKDAIMVTKAGADTLPWLSSCVILPASMAFFILYKRMCEVLPQSWVFHAAIAPLLGFYVLFAAALYPIHTTLHPVGLLQALSYLPSGIHGLIKVVEYWTFSLFFCSAELWGSVVVAVLFWSLANDVCTLEEARSVYPLMGIAANVALVISGSFVKLVCKATATAVHPTHTMLSVLLATVVVSSGLMMAVKAAIDKWVIAPYCSLETASSSKGKKKEKKKEKKSLMASFEALRASPRIASLATLVMSYGIAHRLFEFAWKHQVRVLYDTPSSYQGVLADVSIATGYCTLGLMVLGRFVFQWAGWTAAAAVTPVFMAGAGAVFFIFSIAAQRGISMFSMDPTAMALAGVMSGCACQIVARSAKFSLFDSSKEMVWIEMNREEKSKGKAAVDLLGSQVGKSGGAWVTQLALIFSGSIGAALPVIASVYLVVCTAWLGAVGTLGALVSKLEEEKAVVAAEKAKEQT